MSKRIILTVLALLSIVVGDAVAAQNFWLLKETHRKN